MIRMNYSLPISMGSHTINLPANSTIWSMRNAVNSPKVVYISRITLTIGYDLNDTPGSAMYGLYRFSGATPTGGTSLTPAKGSSKGPITYVADARQTATASLSMDGVTVEPTPFIVTMNQRANAATTTEMYEFDGEDGLLLRPGEGLCIRLMVAGSAGEYIAGSVMWNER